MSEEPQERIDYEEDSDLDEAESPAAEAETADVEGEEAEVEAHGSWGGIG